MVQLSGCSQDSFFALYKGMLTRGKEGMREERGWARDGGGEGGNKCGRKEGENIGGREGKKGGKRKGIGGRRERLTYLYITFKVPHSILSPPPPHPPKLTSMIAIWEVVVLSASTRPPPILYHRHMQQWRVAGVRSIAVLIIAIWGHSYGLNVVVLNRHACTWMRCMVCIIGLRTHYAWINKYLWNTELMCIPKISI